MTCVATLGWQSLLTQTQEKWWQLLLNCGETVALSTSSNSLKKKKKELPFWSPQGIIRIFWMGMMVELSKMRQYPRNSEKKQEFTIIYMEGTMKWEKRGRNWSFKLLWVDWMVTNIMIRCWAVGWINTVWILFSSLPKIVTLGKFPCF